MKEITKILKRSNNSIKVFGALIIGLIMIILTLFSGIDPAKL